MEMLAFISQGLYSFLSVAKIVLLVVIVLCCLVVTVTTLMQSSANQAGSSAVTGGGTDSYFSQNKDNSKDGRLKRITITMASIILGCLVAYFLTGLIIAL